MAFHRIRRIATLFLAMAIGVVPSLVAAQAAWPNRPIRVLVPTPPGGGTDLFARLLSERLAANFKQPFIVDNRAGANGLIAADAVAKAPPDGYTVLFSYTAAMLINPMLHDKSATHPLKNFEPIAQLGELGNLLVVNPELPVHNLAELLAYAKANPATASYGSWGIGSGGHLTMESLLTRTGVPMTHVPYKGVALMATDLMGGALKVGWVDVSSLVQTVTAGKLRAIAVSGKDRLPQLPNVPTMTEQGFPFETTSWYGLFAPLHTDPAIVLRLNAAIAQIVKDPTFQARLESLNMSRLPSPSPQEFKRRIAQDFVTWQALVQAAGIKPE